MIESRSTAVSVVVAIALSLCWTAGIYALGHHTATVQADLDQAKHDLKSERDLQDAKDRLQHEKEDLAAAMASMSDAHRKEIAHEVAARDRLAADLRAGRTRLSVPTARAYDACPASDAGASAPAAGDQAPRAELAPEAAAALTAIASDGDIAIRDLNTVIDMYERARSIKCH